jgi:hypothetical protein
VESLQKLQAILPFPPEEGLPDPDVGRIPMAVAGLAPDDAGLTPAVMGLNPDEGLRAEPGL